MELGLDEASLQDVVVYLDAVEQRLEAKPPPIRALVLIGAAGNALTKPVRLGREPVVIPEVRDRVFGYQVWALDRTKTVRFAAVRYAAGPVTARETEEIEIDGLEPVRDRPAAIRRPRVNLLETPPERGWLSRLINVLRR